MVTVCRVVSPVRISVMGRQQTYATAVSGDAMKFSDERHNIRNVLHDMIGNDKVEFTVRKRVWNVTQVMDDVGPCPRIVIESKCPRRFISAAAYIEDLCHQATEVITSP